MKMVYVIKDLTDEQAKIMESEIKRIAEKHGVEAQTEIITEEEIEAE